MKQIQKDVRDTIKFAFSPKVAELVLKAWTVAESLADLNIKICTNDEKGLAAQLNIDEFKSMYRAAKAEAEAATSEVAEKDAPEKKVGWYGIIDMVRTRLPRVESIFTVYGLRVAEHFAGKGFEINFPSFPQESEVFVMHLKRYMEARKKII